MPTDQIVRTKRRTYAVGYEMKLKLVIFSVVGSVGISGCQSSGGSSASVTITMPSSASKVRAQSVRTTTQPATVSKDWGARAIQTMSEMNCFAVTVGGPEAKLQTNTCSIISGVDRRFGQVVGFSSLAQSVSLVVDPGKAREIRIFGTALPPGQPCPDFNSMNPRQMAQLREVGSATSDLTSGDNSVNITLDLNGPLVGVCSGPDMAEMRVNIDKCNFHRKEVSEGYLPYTGNQFFVLLPRGNLINDYLKTVNPGLSATASKDFSAFGAYLINVTPQGADPNVTIDALCNSKFVSFVEPAYQWLGGAVDDLPKPFMPRPPKPLIAEIGAGFKLTDSRLAAAGVIYTNPIEVVNGIDDDGNGFIDDTQGWNFMSGDFNVSVIGTAGYPDEIGTADSGKFLEGMGIDPLAPTTTPPAQVLSIPYIFSDLEATDTDGYLVATHLASAIMYAAQNGASIIHLPSANFTASKLVDRALQYASESDALIIGPAGDDGHNSDQAPRWPAVYSYTNGLVVGLQWNNGLCGTTSNFGQSSVQLVANPSSVTLAFTGTKTWCTSQNAASFIVGEVARARAMRPDLNAYTIKTLLLNTAAPYAAINLATGISQPLFQEAAFLSAIGTASNLETPLHFYAQ